jgi:hypothetical protein
MEPSHSCSSKLAAYSPARSNQRDRLQNSSQEQRILWLLHSSYPQWTPAPVLAHICLQYCRAIRSLRKAGWQIQNKVVMEAGKRHGFYRLGSPVGLPKQPPAPPPQPDIDSTLFPDQPERHRDDG